VGIMTLTYGGYFIWFASHEVQLSSPSCDCATIQTSAAGVITHEKNAPSARSRVL